MGKIYVISDTHFHTRPLRRWRFEYIKKHQLNERNHQCEVTHPLTGYVDRFAYRDCADFEDFIRRYYTPLIALWNNRFTPADTIIHLGDIFGTTGKDFQTDHMCLIKYLHGTKILVLGNHDLAPLWAYRNVFHEVHRFYRRGGLLFSHTPVCPDIPRFAKHKIGRYWESTTQLDLTGVQLNVHGHFHQQGLTTSLRTAQTSGFTTNDPPTTVPFFHYGVADHPVRLKSIRNYRNKSISSKYRIRKSAIGKKASAQRKSATRP